MKMRRTIYPVALIIAIPLVLLVFYILNQGKFEKIETMEQSANIFAVDDRLYMQLNLEWKGFGNPVLKSFSAKGVENDRIQSFISQANGEFSLEQTLEKMSAGEKLPGVADYKLTGNTLTIVLEMAKADVDQMKEEATFLLRYRTFGITREQEISLPPAYEQQTTFEARILENDSILLVEPAKGEAELRSADQITLSTKQTVLLDEEGKPIDKKDFVAGDFIEIIYDGMIAESYPAQIHRCIQIQKLETDEEENTNM